MPNVLVSHAINNVWAEPDQDYQHLVRAVPYTSNEGRMKSVILPTQAITLPFISGRPYALFHMYHFGNMPNDRISLVGVDDTWVNAKTVIAECKQQIDICMMSGVQILRGRVWFRRLRDDNLIMAIENNLDDNLGTKPDGKRRYLNDEAIYVRFYRNAITKQPDWINSSPKPDEPVFYDEKKIGTTGDYTSFVSSATTKILSYGSSVNKAQWFLDGYLIPAPTGYSSAYVNRTLAVMFDSTVKSVVTRPISGLSSFKSVKDLNRMKYLVFGDAVSDSIDYHDDVDIYVGSPTCKVYLARLSDIAVRQVTHSSYAVSCGHVKALLDSHSDLQLINNPELLLYVREGGMTNPLIDNSLYLAELDLLTQSQIQSLLIETNSIVPCWKASIIENSAYNRLLSSDIRLLDTKTVAEGYGFHMSQVVAFDPVVATTPSTPSPVFNVSVGYSELPEISGNNFAAFYHDDDGHYLSYENKYINAQTQPLAISADNNNAKLVELLPKPVSVDQFGDVYYQQTIVSNDLSNYGFRCYVCHVDGSIPDEQWVDCTDSAYYVYTPKDPANGGVDSLVWNTGVLNSNQLYGAVKIDKQVLCYQADVSSYVSNGWIEFTVGSITNWLGTPTLRPHTIAYEHLDVYLNGELLIMGIDYTCYWPKVVIHRKPDSLTPMTVIVRAYGLSTLNGNQPRSPDEIGYSRGGLLSANHQFNLWENRISRVNFNGGLMLSQNVPFSERSNVTPVLDGRPYSVDVYRFNIDKISDGMSQSLLANADALDPIVSNQLTVMLADNYPANGVVDGYRHELYSPLMSALIYAMANLDYLANGELANEYNPDDVADLLGPYYYLLDFDPARVPVDSYFVNIYPHIGSDTKEVTSDQYAFLQYINRHYLRDQVDLSSRVQIGV